MSVPSWSTQSSIELTACPECGEVAEVTDRFTLLSTSGPVGHVRVSCILGHRFCLPEDARSSRSPRSPEAHRSDRSAGRDAPAA